MSKIKCNQKKCKHNNCEHCMLDGIQVDKEANCKSYEEGESKSNHNFEFASFESLGNSVMCNATECLYNKHKNCIVSHLNIGKSQNNAPCIDYEKRN
jgi:hypothetical protein